MSYRAAGLTTFLFFTLQGVPQPARDPLFSGVEKFEKNAVSVVRVESDHDHNRSDADSNQKRLSTVYVFKYDQPGQYNAAEVEVYRRKLHTSEWTCKVCPRHLKAGEVVDACTRPTGNAEIESAVIDMQPMALTFVHSTGKAASEHQTECSTD